MKNKTFFQPTYRYDTFNVYCLRVKIYSCRSFGNKSFPRANKIPSIPFSLIIFYHSSIKKKLFSWCFIKEFQNRGLFFHPFSWKGCIFLNGQKFSLYFFDETWQCTYVIVIFGIFLGYDSSKIFIFSHFIIIPTNITINICIQPASVCNHAGNKISTIKNETELPTNIND